MSCRCERRIEDSRTADDGGGGDEYLAGWRVAGQTLRPLGCLVVGYCRDETRGSKEKAQKGLLVTWSLEDIQEGVPWNQY